MPDYPPLTPVEEYPLHGWDYNRDYACRTLENTRTFDWRCPDCVAIAETYDPEITTFWKLNEGIEEQQVALGWLVARSRALGV